ncbi:hypothetical protein HYPSUDRAFT_50751 [Hypholoma sublateritium FD-334 SS-4]|uniref:Uncharacterized protein n=1 Tax=Hypholoma sublateritium (strain FD-334 SS-4) TaxID=945553 RepID=A0A0D2MYY1_HYPSF|nr:hypothetical protein HYPSUDRAFT_50751 [Hypholoma sublateritium FD-334 SS-4]
MHHFISKSKSKERDDFSDFATSSSRGMLEAQRIFFKKYTLCARKDKRQLCTSLTCKYNNPPQAASGRYNCIGCSSGTYFVTPDEVTDKNSFPVNFLEASSDARKKAYAIVAVKGRDEFLEQQKGFMPIPSAASLERRRAATKPLPSTPGLDRRRAASSHGKVRRNPLAETAKPPKGEIYRPPVPTQHASAARNMLRGQLLYPASSSTVNLLPQAMSLVSLPMSEYTTSSDEGAASSHHPVYPSRPGMAKKTRSQNNISNNKFTYEVMNMSNGRLYL